MATILSELEIREAFHCVLLAHLPADYRASAIGVPPLRLKGGVNLRLFHSSPRYSEDMDFDLSPARGARFIEHLRRLLNDSVRFRRHLLTLGIQDLAVSELDGGDGGFKQKVGVLVGGVRYPTKVEVAYHEETAPAEAVIVTIPEPFHGRYRLGEPVRVAAYPSTTALWQKVLALSRRTAPQTRDVFDVDHLQRQVGTNVTAAARAMIRARMRLDQVRTAAEVVAQFTAAQFRDQTATYLPESARQATIADWPNMQHRVWEWLALLHEEMHAPSAPPPEGSDAQE
jgi:predicted nucleotidyltransferase component of viral defense system